MQQESRAGFKNAFLFAVVLTAVCPRTWLLAEPVPAKAHAFHIEVLVQGFDGKPIGWLRSSDFHVTLQGQEVPALVTRPVLRDKTPVVRFVPTRLLVVVTAPSDDSDHAAGVTRGACPSGPEDGRLPLRIAMAALRITRQELRSCGELWTAAPRPGSSIKAAIGKLAWFRGRRIVLVLAGNSKASTPPPGWLPQMASDSMEQFFVVDGGLPNSLPEGLGGVAPSFPPDDSGRYLPAVPGPPYCGAKCSGSGRISTPDHEVNVHRAVRDAMRFALGFYGIRVKYPATEPIPPDATLTLQIRCPSSFQVAAQVYGKDSVPKLEVTKRQ